MLAFQVAVLKSAEQFLLIKFDHESQQETQVLPVEELKKKNLQTFFFSKTEHEAALQEIDLGEISRKTPVRALEDFQLNANQIVELSGDQLFNTVKKIQQAWLLQNHVSLLEEFFAVIRHLKKLWPNERTAFFEEIWAHLQRNLGTIELKVIYNDLESDKNKLVRAMVAGKRSGNPQLATEIENKIMDHYQSEFNQVFKIVDYDEAKGEMVAVAQIKESPVVIMAKVCQLTRMQKAIVQALVDGIGQ